MPYTESQLPFSGDSPQSRRASRQGAVSAAGRAPSQVARVLQALKDRPWGLTDQELADLLGIQRSTINARRSELVKGNLVYAAGFKDGKFGTRNVVWKAR
jgi:hypothetical protein